jgi:hypothetical protein
MNPKTGEQIEVMRGCIEQIDGSVIKNFKEKKFIL